MIIVKISQGLGNQLFQYSLSRSLAEKLSVEVKLDIRDMGANRVFLLDRYNTKYQIASIEEINRLLGKTYLERKLRSVIDNFLPCNLKSKIKDNRGYNEKLFTVNDNSYLAGWWQSFKYFAEIEDVIRKELILKTKFQIENEAILAKINGSNSVSIHFRRTDYLSPGQKEKFCELGKDYYVRAIDIIKNKISKPCFFVFSDDIEWVKQNFTFTDSHFFVSASKYQDFQELELMSLCKHNIIANSTFSWWAAWLNAYPNKTVIAPLAYFRKYNLDVNNRYPETWIKI